MTCREVRLLRTFAPMAQRVRAMRKLLTRYAAGHRAASDVVAASRALLAQMRGEEAAWMLRHALRAVRPVPALVWDHACERLAELGTGTLALRMLAMAVHDPRLGARLAPHHATFQKALDARLELLKARTAADTAIRTASTAIRTLDANVA